MSGSDPKRTTHRRVVGALLVGLGGVALFLVLLANTTPDVVGLKRNENLLLGAGLLVAIAGINLRYAPAWSASFIANGFRPAHLITLSVLVGICTGLGEVLILAVRRFVLHTPVARSMYASPYDFWMIPLVDLALFLALGGGLVVLVVWWKRGVGALSMAVFAVVCVGACGLLFRFDPALDKKAALVLAVGLSVRLTSGLATRGAQFRAAAHRMVTWGTLIALGMAGGAWLWHVWPTARLAPAAQAARGAPNVLLIVLDTVRAQSLSAYGYERYTTPWLSKFAKTGVRFEWAISTSPWTLPSHASMFTGHFPSELWRADETPLGGEIPLRAEKPTLAEVMQQGGYSTAGFVANTIYCSYRHGLDRGFEHYEDFEFSLSEAFFGSALGGEIRAGWRRLRGDHAADRKTADDINAAFLGWVGTQPAERPWFAFLNYFDVHDPYEPPKPYDKRFGPAVPSGLSKARRKFETHEIRSLRDAYDGSLAYLDDRIGTLIHALQAAEMLKDTLVVITADHGEHFGEHELMFHGNSLYRPLVHVPLIVSFPGRLPAGRVVGQPVSLRDLPATVTELAGVDGSVFPGASLASLWSGSPDPSRASPILSELLVGDDRPEWWPDWWPSAHGPMSSLFDRQLHYIVDGAGSELLFDVGTDPEESEDLLGTARGQGEVERLRDEVRSATRH